MEKIWLNQYQKGVPAEINPDQYHSLVELFIESCEKYDQNPAFENMHTNISYRELLNQSQKLAVFLQQSGLKKGDRIAIMMPNSLQYPVALFGILLAGCVVVNTNPLYTSEELIFQLNDSNSQAIIVLANFANTLEKALPYTPQLKHIIITELGDLFPFFKRIFVNNFVKYIKKMVPSYHIPQAISLNYALKIGGINEYKPVKLDHDDIAFFQYTGGTTGIAKAAMLSHGNMIANIIQVSAWIASLDIKEQDIIITALPLYHIFSLTANCLTFINSGAKNILITNPREISHFIKEIKNVQFTAITGVNTLFNTLLHHPKFSSIDFSKVKLALAGGMPLQKNVSIEWHEKTNTRILEAYGLTETSPAVAINPMYLEEYNGSIGLPIPSTDVSIRDGNGIELPLGEIGELCVKGPQVMRSYWRQESETELVFWPDGYLRTGDNAKMDDKGYIYLIDRRKDMILVSGFNVYPNEVEQVISSIPGVLEVGVIGVQNGESGEKVKACIVKNDPNLTAEDIIDYTRKHLTAYKIPKLIEFYDELPKSNVGKILRRELR